MGHFPSDMFLHANSAFHFSRLLWRFSPGEAPTLRWTLGYLIGASWLLFAAYWFVTAFGAKAPAKVERATERVGHIILMVIGFMLLRYAAPQSLNWLNRRFLPDVRWIYWLGAYLTFAGVMFAIWARRSIGKEWSATVQIKQDHQLIRSGPYARIRHPIYTGILWALAGTTLTIGEYRALLGLAVIAVGFVQKAKKEEAFLAAQFGPAFQEHQRQTGFFLPRL
jgi:protein-S-isoprenylcysteine O-methyltransferase Ste14